MAGLRILLAVIFVVVGVYTLPVVLDHGLLALLPTFFGDMAAMGWPGQFNLDFMMFLVLSATWTAWRHQWSGAGFGLALGALFLGAPWLSAYLFIHSRRHDGDWAALLLGPERAATR